jgi:hypothetical protein
MKTIGHSKIIRRVALFCTFAFTCNDVSAQQVPRDFGLYDSLSTVFGNKDVRILTGVGHLGPVINAIFRDSVALTRPWSRQEPIAKSVAKYVYAHADTFPKLAVVDVGYEARREDGTYSVRFFRFPAPTVGDTLSDALPSPGEMPSRVESRIHSPNRRLRGKRINDQLYASLSLIDPKEARSSLSDYTSDP